MESVCAVILAAGDGKRMKSALPKVMCQVLFKPMIRWVADSVVEAEVSNACVILGDNGEAVEAVLPEGFATAVQQERKGTGHAVMMARDYIQAGGFEHVLVLCGDAPFVQAQEITRSFQEHERAGNCLTVLTAEVENPYGYGRIVRSGQQVTAIVEQADADEATAQIREINSGGFWFQADFLLEALEHLKADNAQGEYYLTDTLSYAVGKNYRAGACIVSPEAALGANDRKGLALLNQAARERILDFHLANGVNVPFPEGIIIGPDVEIGPDTTILPGTVLRGKTSVGASCELGPNSYLENAVIRDNCRVLSTYVDSSTLESGVKIGPMSNVRPGSYLDSGVKVGDFVEIKNSNIGKKTAVAHLTYVGDSDVGEGCNFGCGVVTVNYDGANKHRTTIGDNVFIGCNSNLVAPVKVGNRAYSAAGTTITEDVPDDALVIGRARQTVKENWAAKTGRFSKK